MKNGLLLSLAAFFACALPANSFAATAGSQTSHSIKAVQQSKTHSAAGHARPAAVQVRVAPADEYFGRQKLSILGINNTIHDTNLRIGFDPAHAAKYYGQLATVQDSLLDWARKYPHDTWLPGRAYYLSHVFWQLHSTDGDAGANKCRTMLFKQFPKSHWAMLAQKETRDSVAPLTTADMAARNAGNAANAADGTAVVPAAAANASNSGALGAAPKPRH